MRFGTILFANCQQTIRRHIGHSPPLLTIENLDILLANWTSSQFANGRCPDVHFLVVALSVDIIRAIMGDEWGNAVLFPDFHGREREHRDRVSYTTIAKALCFELTSWPRSRIYAPRSLFSITS